MKSLASEFVIILRLGDDERNATVQRKITACLVTCAATHRRTALSYGDTAHD